MILYAVNTASLRDGRWRQAQVEAQCQKAAGLTAGGDLYGAIALCEAAGIGGVLAVAKPDSPLYPLARQYGLWLGQTFDRSNEAIGVLEKLRQLADGTAAWDAAMAAALTEARLKQRVLTGEDGQPPLSGEEQRTPFGQAVITGEQPIPIEIRDIDFGAFSNIFLFAGDRVYIGRYGSEQEPGGGTSIAVLDRNSLKQIAAIPVVPPDGDFQDNIASIAADANHIYATIGYRYGDSDPQRTNFVIIDKDTLQIRKKMHINAPLELFMDGEQLFACTCPWPGSGEPCMTLDPETGKTADALTTVCANPFGGLDQMAHTASGFAEGKNLVALTKDYLIGRSFSSQDAIYTAYPRHTGQAVIIPVDKGVNLDRMVSISGNKIREFSPKQR